MNFTESDLWTWSVLCPVLCFLLIEQEPILSCCHCVTVTRVPYCRLTSDSFITSDHRTVVWSERTVLLHSRAGFVPRRRLKTFGCISCWSVGCISCLSVGCISCWSVGCISCLSVCLVRFFSKLLVAFLVYLLVAFLVYLFAWFISFPSTDFHECRRLYPGA